MTLGKSTEGGGTRRLGPESGKWGHIPDGHFQGVKWILQGKVWVNLINLSEKRIYPSLPRIRQHHKLYPWRGTSNDYQRVENAANNAVLCLYSTFICPLKCYPYCYIKHEKQDFESTGESREVKWLCCISCWLSDQALGPSPVAYFWPGGPSAESARQGTNSGSFQWSAFIEWCNDSHDPKVISISHSNFILEQHTFQNVCNMR